MLACYYGVVFLLPEQECSYYDKIANTFYRPNIDAVFTIYLILWVMATTFERLVPILLDICTLNPFL